MYFVILPQHFALGGLVCFAAIYIICVMLDWMSYLFGGSVP